MSKNKKNWITAIILIPVAATGFYATLSDPPAWWVGILAAVIGLALMVLMGWTALRPGKQPEGGRVAEGRVTSTHPPSEGDIPQPKVRHP